VAQRADPNEPGVCHAVICSCAQARARTSPTAPRHCTVYTWGRLPRARTTTHRSARMRLRADAARAHELSKGGVHTRGGRAGEGEGLAGRYARRRLTIGYYAHAQSRTPSINRRSARRARPGGRRGVCCPAQASSSGTTRILTRFSTAESGCSGVPLSLLIDRIGIIVVFVTARLNH